MTITPEDLVRREVHYCVSFLVSTLACATAPGRTGNPLTDLVEQAMDLAAPLDDWEEAATEAGWSGEPGVFKRRDLAATYKADSWRELCELEEIEPYQREVFEHWIVSDWLADKLDAKGEKVDKDFAGLTIWARTTTGQGIACDWVIDAICAELNQ